MAQSQRENFYILLALSLDPPVVDSVRIKQAIYDKQQEWTRWQDDPEKREKALANLALIPEIKQVMQDAQLRQKEAQSALIVCDQKRTLFAAELRVLESKGYILPEEADALERKYCTYGVNREMIDAQARCPISETPVPKEVEDGEALDRRTAKKIQKNLSLLGFADLYEFLGEPQYSSTQKLAQIAERKLNDALEHAGRSETANDVQALAEISLVVFADFETKQKYDRFLKVGRYPALGEMIDQEYGRTLHVSTESLLRLVNFGVERYGMGVLVAEDVIRRYCAAYRIPIGDQGVQIQCPACGADNSTESAVCTSCAQPLKGSCPRCGVSFENGPAACPGCGFAVGEMGKAIDSMSQAEMALIENDWATARQHLAYASKYWPGHPRLDTLLKRAVKIEDRYAAYVHKINDYISHNQYYTAQELIIEAQGRRITLPEATVQHVRQVIADVEQKITVLRSADRPPEFEEIMQLAETVGDSMELTHLMRRFPPDSPSKIIASIHERSVRLTWTKSESTGMKEYVVVRRQDAVPLTAYDGDILYEGPANSFLDRTADSLCEYYYSVYTRRGGAFSLTAATTDIVLLVPEIERLRILPMDMGAQVSWTLSPDVTEIAVWRKLGGKRPTEPGQGELLENVRLDGFTDSNLKNGVEYWYYICAAYEVGGRKAYSKGICESIVPRQMLAPIQELIVAKTDTENEYVASWQGSNYGDVLLFYADTQPSCVKGEVLMLADLIEQYGQLEVKARQPESARFHHNWNGGLYVFPAAIMGRFATVGDIRYLTNVQDVCSPAYELRDGDLYVRMKWPEGLNEIAVAYRFDTFAASPEDANATVVRFTREQYDEEGGICLQEAEPALYYITIFSVFDTPENRRVYSPGVNLLADNSAKMEVFYKFNRTKKFFSQISVISATISGDRPFTLPRSVIVGKVGRMPLSRNDGIPLFEIDRETRVEGSVMYEYRTSSLPENLYIRLFLQDEALYSKLRLLPLGGMKIT